MFQVAVGTRGSSSCIVTSVVNYFTRVVHPQEMSTSPHTRVRRSKRGRTKEEMHISTEVGIGGTWLHRNIEFHGAVSRCIADQRNRSLRPLPSSSTSSTSIKCVVYIAHSCVFQRIGCDAQVPPLFLSLLADPLNEHKHKLVSSNRAAGRARSLRTVNWWVNLLRWMSEGVGFFYGYLVLGEGRESFLLIRFG